MSYIDSVGSFISGGDGDIRVMSYNLLVDSDDYDWGTPLGERPTGAAACIRRYSPDVVGLQEASAGWFAAFRELLKGEYEFFNPDFKGGKTTSTPRLYIMCAKSDRSPVKSPSIPYPTASVCGLSTSEFSSVSQTEGVSPFRALTSIPTTRATEPRSDLYR